MERRATADHAQGLAGEGAALRMVIVHIGKTGGTALSALLEADRARAGVARARVLTHADTLASAAEAYPGVELGFCLRDPITRFVSGFYSRLRCGRPRYDNPWTPSEAVVFTAFETPGALADALAAGDPAAASAMERVPHLRRGLAHHLESIETLERHSDRIGFIGMQENLARDAEWLKRRLGIAPDIGLPEDDIGAHRNPADVDRALSPAARAALERYYAQDYVVRDWCLAKRQELGLD